MIVYPKDWKKNYEDLNQPNITLEIINVLQKVLKEINVPYISYSGGVDSTIVLAIMSQIFDKVYTYTISSRATHPDVLFARQGSRFYKTIHREFIVAPTRKESDVFNGDNAVRQLFELLPSHTNKIICCDGIDEFMCGYYDHQENTVERYKHYLSRLLPDHLIPLHNNSGDVEVFEPYLDERLVNIFRNIPLSEKVDSENRKKIMFKIASELGVPKEIIERNKYGFVDAFRECDK